MFRIHKKALVTVDHTAMDILWELGNGTVAFNDLTCETDPKLPVKAFDEINAADFHPPNCVIDLYGEISWNPGQSFHGLLQCVLQLLGLNGFQEEKDMIRLINVGAVFYVSRDEDHRNAAAARKHVFCQLNSIFSSKQDVHQHDVWCLVRDFGAQRFGRGAGRNGEGIRKECLNLFLQLRGNDRVVIADQNMRQNISPKSFFYIIIQHYYIVNVIKRQCLNS